MSKETISRITDKVIEEMNDWSSRPLSEVYAAIFIDASVVKIRDAQVSGLADHRGLTGLLTDAASQQALASRYRGLLVAGVGLFEVTIEISDDLDAVLTIYQDAPLARLPVGKSFSLRADAHNKTMGGPRAPDQFDLVVKGRLDDGTEFRQEIFIDLIG